MRAHTTWLSEAEKSRIVDEAVELLAGGSALVDDRLHAREHLGPTAQEDAQEQIVLVLGVPVEGHDGNAR